MATQFYKTVKGQRVAMTNKEVKSYIMKVNGWTTDQYNKQYDILRNKLRAYESYEKASGRKVSTQSTRDLLFKEAKTKQRMGANYTPSIKMQRIKQFTSVSSGKAGQRALQGKVYMERRTRTYNDATYKQFKGLINNNAQARTIYQSIKDPVKREQALADFANKLHVKINEAEEVEEASAIPFGETIGSDESIDFDISLYM